MHVAFRRMWRRSDRSCALWKEWESPAENWSSLSQAAYQRCSLSGICCSLHCLHCMDEWVGKVKMRRDRLHGSWFRKTHSSSVTGAMIRWWLRAGSMRPFPWCRNSVLFLLLNFCLQSFVVISRVQPWQIMATALLQINLCCVSFHFCFCPALRSQRCYPVRACHKACERLYTPSMRLRVCPDRTALRGPRSRTSSVLSH